MIPRIRGHKGVKIRKTFRAQHPWCRHCLNAGLHTRSTQVDHIVRLADGGINHPDNYQALCDKCHKAKTAAENGKIRAEIGSDGYPVE